MIYINRDNKVFTNSYESKNGIVTGTAFIGYRSLYGEDLLNYVSSWETAEEWKQGLLDLNGFYAIIIIKNNKVFAAVDRIRSLPLFYGLHEGNLFISNDARWVREQVGDKEIDSLAKEEFLLTGFVVGSDTLFPSVKQIQAGEVVFFGKNETGDFKIDPHRYYRYLHSNYYEESEKELQRMFDDVLQNVFQRLISYAHGRTIVVPLSGGYDSRLIVLMLKRLGYEKVIAFSYGRPGNHEAEVSKQVAESLGVRWEFVEYSNELWREWYEAPEMKEYFNMAGNLASLPHIQDWPAVWVLQKEGRIPPNSIFVPGHSADLPAGSRSKSVPDIYKGPVSRERLIGAIIGYHYSLFDWSKKKRALFPFFEKKILEVLGDLDQYPDQSSAFESWDISERQPKFIVNSLRVYEFFGYEWWIPFWDKEFMDYWCRISPEKRLNQSLYVSYVNDLANKRGLEISEHTSKTEILKKWMKACVKRILPTEVKKWVKKEMEKRYFLEHPMAWYGVHRDDFVRAKITEGATIINSLLVTDYLDGISKSNIEKD